MASQPIKSVLVVSLKSLPTWHVDVAEVFQESGISARVFITTPQTAQETLDKSIKKTKWFLSDHTLQRLQADCRIFRPDLILFLGMFVLPSKVVEVLSTGLDYKPLLAGWVCDCFREPQFKEWSAADHVFYFDTFLESVLPTYYPDSSSLTYLPLAANPRRYYPITTPKKRTLLFVGTLSDDRKALIDKISKEIPVDVFGPRSSRQRFKKRKKLSADGINTLYNQHEMTLNINQSPNTENGANLRVFEATANGALLLTQHCNDLDPL